MKRRAFTIGTVASIWAGAAIAGERMPGDSAPVQLWVPGLGPVRVSGLYLGAGFGMAFPGGAALHDEARADFSGAGALAGLFRTPFAHRWADAAPLGDLRFADGVLVAAGPVPDLPGQRVTLGVDGASWDLPGVIGARAAVAAAGLVIGALGREADGRVLAYVPARVW